ncbi:MAG: hypothetical protein ACNA8K_04725 [Cyclonatronaceae bacterium]
MKRLLSLFIAAGFLFAFTPTDDVTVTGTLVDTKCYGEMPDVNKTNDHMVPMENGEMAKIPNCATACANMGIPAAVATNNGKTVTIIAPAGQLAEHMGKEVRIAGKVAFEGNLIPKKVEVRDGRQWKTVNITFMM